MAVIAVDLDNTLYDFSTIARDVFLELAEEYEDKSIQRGAYHPWTEWRSLVDACGLDIAQEVIDRCHSEEVVMSRKPFEGAVDTLWDLRDYGHELRYISSRQPNTQDHTEDWLWNVACVPEGRVICTMDDKIPYLPDAQYLIDDRPKTIVEFIYNYEWRNKWGPDPKKQRKAFAISFPCNLNLTDIPNLYLAPTWNGIRQYLLAKGVLNEVTV